MIIGTIEKRVQGDEELASRILADLVQRGYPPLLKQKDVETITQLKSSMLEQARLKGTLDIPFIYLGKRCVRYPLESLASYLASLQRCTSTSEVKGR